jgi:two-component system heavy metal sensor histidine kinase CusS
VSSALAKNAPEAPAGRRPWSLAARLTAWYAGATFLLLLAATGFLYWVLTDNLEREDDEFLADRVQVFRTQLRDRPADLRRDGAGDWTVRQNAPIYLRLLDAGGRVLLETPGMSADLAPQLFPPPVAVEAPPGRGVEVETPAGQSYRLLAALVADPAGGPPRLLQAAFDRTAEEALLARYRRNLAVVLVLALAACTLVGHRIARRSLRPVAEIAATARHIRATHLRERIDVRGFPAELSLLARTFNEMLGRLEEAFERLARFSADIAHELRTPVNNLRGEAEVALSRPRSPEEYREVLASALEEYARLTRLIDSLLFLARAESPAARVDRERLDLGRELALVRDFYEAAAAEAGVTLRLDVAGSLFADMDRTLLQQAVGNLVANALAHTPAGGTVTLSAAREGEAVHVEVADTGSGIAPEHLPHVFDRFYRAEAARAASAAGRVGLGLALVKSIAALHQGTATIRSTLGKGTHVRLVLPCRAAAEVRELKGPEL